MDSAQALIAVVVVALALVAGGLVVSHSATDAGGSNPTTESISTGAVNSTSVLNQSYIDRAVYSNTANVVNDTGIQMIAGEDYEWDGTNGTLTVKSDRLAGEDNVSVSYNYRVQSETESGTVGILTYLLDSAAFIPLILMIGVLVLGIAAFGGVRD